MKNYPQVSVIVCTHNRADMLPNVIGKLRAQEYPAESFEIIVVDNASTDQTPWVVKRFVTQPGVTVRYIAENRLGITFARNRGAEEACYPYLAYLDDDCSVETDWLSQLVSGFDLHTDVVIVGGRVVLDWRQTERPAWLGSGLEPWLGANNHLGAQPRLLDEKMQVMEGNMAVQRAALKAAGGFLGMEKFGSQNMAAGEVLYLLYQLRKHGGKVAFAPGAVALHKMGKYTIQRFLKRGYWQGVSDGILDHLIHKRSFVSQIEQISVNAVGMLFLAGCSLFYWLLLNKATSTVYLVRSLRRLGLVLCQLHFVGDWHHVRSWMALHPQLT